MSDTESSDATTDAETVKTPETGNAVNPESPEVLSEEEFNAAIGAAETQDTYDERTGLDLPDVMEAVAEEGVDLMGMKEGETVEIQVDAPAMYAAAASSEDVTITKGSWYYYSDYDLGTYVTAPYYISYGDITATAYCVQPSKDGPDDGTYKITKLSDGKTLAKVCYYGTKASDEDGFFAKKHPGFAAGKKFIITHLAASYAYGSDDAFSGTNAEGQKLAKELYNFCVSQPDIPDVAMSFSKDNVKAYVDGSSQRTEEVTFKADAQQTITFKLPKGVKLHNTTKKTTSAAGASVEISGGTKFYLSAPLTQATDVGATFSSKMKGSITKEYSAYKISTGGGKQDLAFVFGEGVTSEKYVNFTATWVQQATVSIVKKDRTTGKKLAGAVYGLYSNAACTSLITQMPATDAKGASSVTIMKTQNKVYLKEITAPKGYQVDTASYNIKLVASGTVKKNVSDQEQLAQLTIYKEGEELTGAKVTGCGVTFTYEKKKQRGAVFNVYAGADITAADGTTVYKKGALVAGNLTTGADGSVTVKNLHLGTYTVTEAKAPANLVCTGESKSITLSYAGQSTETVFGSLTFTNDRQKAKVYAYKQDKDTKNPLPGAVFGLYAGADIQSSSGATVVRKDTLIASATTDGTGKAEFNTDLPINSTYYVKETRAPKNYYRNMEDVFSFDFRYSNDRVASQSFSHTFSNDRVNATIHLVKRDKETGEVTQGDATFEGAVYGIYARENIVHPDGATGVLYKKDALVTTVTTDAAGNAKAENLYLGKYYVKEITPPTGYLLDEEEHDIECSYEGDLVKTIERTAISSDQVIKQPFQVIKAANNGKTDADLLSGVGFSAYLASSLKTNADGSYNFAGAQPVVITDDGRTEMFTDTTGHAVSIPLPYGVYVVRETTTPHNFTPVDDFIVTIRENHPDKPQVWRVLLDDEFEAKLKIVKKDDETEKSVLLPNTEFKVYDLDNSKYVEQVTTYPTVVTHKSYFTDEQGYLILPQNLKIGHYRIEEVTAPEGYTLSTNYVTVNVDSNTAYLMDPVSGDAIIEADYANHPVKGKLTVWKEGEVLSEYDGDDFRYKTSKLAGAVFEVSAAEDIYTPDYQRDEAGNRVVIYKAGTVVTTITTDAAGKAVAENLPLGAYKVTEVTAPKGFVLNGEAQGVTFAYAGQDTPVVEQELTFKNDRQKVRISVEKQDAENGETVAGAEFAIYAAEDIMAGDTVVMEADTEIERAVSDKDGLAVFTKDLPLGRYYVKETKAPAGYVSSDEIIEVDASYQGQDVAVVTVKSEKKNDVTTVEFTKSDLTTGVELDGATMTVLDKEGNVLDRWTSVKDEPHTIKRLTAGETYTLREEFAPYGYLRAADVEFTVEDTAEIQKVEMKDEVPTALLIINKKGEFLDKVTPVDGLAGMVEHLFEYVTGNLTEVTFEVYAAEDIKAADGVSEDYYSKDELVGTITTDDNGIARMEGLPAGKYYVKETETAHGYVLDGEPRYVDLSYRDQDTPVITYDESWQNARQKVSVNVLKKEKDTDRVLEGGVFGLFAGEDILSASGEVLMEKDTLIELKTTDENGQITFAADLPVDGSYYVQEVTAPDGFVTTNEKQEFVFEYAGEEQETATYAFVFENEATTVELSKKDLTTGEELPGAHLTVLDENGDVVDEWISEEESHVIKELTVGKTYTMVETIPADGYVTADSVAFTVENTAEIQTQEMLDDVTRVQISKTDISGEQEVPGAKLTILDENEQVVDSWVSEEEPHDVEKLPIGSYTLREEQAPKGYVLAEDVTFEVADTGEIQTVQMKDDTAKGRVIINKTDKDSGEPMKGVEFELRDSHGKVLETLKTDAAGHAESDLYEIASYKKGAYDEQIKYSLVETKTLEGYALDPTKHEVAFDYADDSTPVIEATYDLTNEKAPTPVETAVVPKTGDDTNLWFPILLMVGAACGFVAAASRRKRNRK